MNVSKSIGGVMYNNKQYFVFAMFAFFMNALLSAQQENAGNAALLKYLSKAEASKKIGYKKSFAKGALEGVAVTVPSLPAVSQFANIMPPYSTYISKIWPAVMIAGSGIRSMWNDAFSKSTPEWVEQLRLLLSEQDELRKPIIGKKVAYFGVPVDKVDLTNWFGRKKYVSKAYLLSSNFDDITNAFTDNHYEIYLMPKDEYLGDLFVALTKYLNTDKKLGAYVSFVAIRPTPGITKSPFNGKNLPRIIIGFKPSATQLDVINVAQDLDKKFKETWENYATVMGLNILPRYSQKINDLMYAAYGSADYKDSVKAQAEYAPKAKTFFQRWWSGPSDDDMAYRDDAFAITVKGKYSEEL